MGKVIDIEIGGLTLCQVTVRRWCRQDDSGKFEPLRGGICACGASRLPVDTGFAPLLPDPDDIPWEKVVVKEDEQSEDFLDYLRESSFITKPEQEDE